MKKYLTIIAVVLLAVVSCGKFEPGGTATQEFAGQWQVVCYAVDANEDVLYVDPFDVGEFMAMTYNAMQNYPDSIFFSCPCDPDHEFTALVPVTKAGKFGLDDTDFLNYESGNAVSVWGGEILKGAATTPSGMPADSIHVSFNVAGDAYVGAVYDHLVIAGFRYTGFKADEPLE